MNGGMELMTEYKQGVDVGVSGDASTEKAVKRDNKESWPFIYLTFGFALSLGSTLISMIPFHLCNIAFLLIYWALTYWLFIECEWFRSKLIGYRAFIEEKFRPL